MTPQQESYELRYAIAWRKLALKEGQVMRLPLNNDNQAPEIAKQKKRLAHMRRWAKQGVPTAEIARRIHMSPSHTSKIMRDAGIPNGTEARRRALEKKIVQLGKLGLPTSEIAKRLKTSLNTINALIGLRRDREKQEGEETKQ